MEWELGADAFGDNANEALNKVKLIRAGEAKKLTFGLGSLICLRLIRG